MGRLQRREVLVRSRRNHTVARRIQAIVLVESFWWRPDSARSRPGAQQGRVVQDAKHTVWPELRVAHTENTRISSHASVLFSPPYSIITPFWEIPTRPPSYSSRFPHFSRFIGYSIRAK